MLNTNNNYLDQAAEYWRQNQPLKAGRLIFENLPREARSLWASNILKSVVERTGIESSSIKNILQIANHPSEWNKAHEAFSLARAETLKLNRFQEKTIEQMLLVQQMGLAELVAKVIYNCTDPQDECWCKSVSVICLSFPRLHPSGVRRSEGERSEPSAAEPRRGEDAPRAKKMAEGGSYWFPVGVSQTHPTYTTA
jgi:hypothetical protein